MAASDRALAHGTADGPHPALAAARWAVAAIGIAVALFALWYGFFFLRDSDAPKIVMDLRVEDQATASFTGYLVYRADRIATLYPASSGVTVTRP